MSTEEVKSALNTTFGSAEVKTIGNANQLKLSTKYKVNENSAEADEEVQSMLFESLRPFLPDGMSYEDFVEGSGDKKIGKMLSSKVSPTIADDIKKSSIWAILGSLSCSIPIHFITFQEMAILFRCSSSSIPRYYYCIRGVLSGLYLLCRLVWK